MSNFKTELGRIVSAEFGKGGYQEAMIGVSFNLGGEAWGVWDFWGAWAIKRDDHAKWSEQERLDELGRTVMRLNEILSAAKVSHVSDLAGTPVQVQFLDMKLQSWRILTEVL